MTTDLFERRLRRDLNVIADTVAAREGAAPMAFPAPRKTRGHRNRSALAAGVAAAAVVVAGVAVVAGGPDETLTSGAVSPGCPAAAEPQEGATGYVVGSGTVNGTDWSVRTSGAASAPDVSISSFLDSVESAGNVHDERSWHSVVNAGTMEWTYDTNPDGFTVVYGFLPPEAEAVRVNVDGAVSEVCAATVAGDPVRYFATTIDARPDEVVAVDASGGTVMKDTPGTRLDGDGDAAAVVGTGVTVTGRVSLPVGGTAVVPPAPVAPLDVLAAGRAAGVDWELLAGPGGMHLVPFGGLYDAADTAVFDPGSDVYNWWGTGRDGGWWLAGDAPADVAAVHVRFADGHTETVDALVHPDVPGRSFFAAAVEGHGAPVQAVLEADDGSVRPVAVGGRLAPGVSMFQVSVP